MKIEKHCGRPMVVMGRVLLQCDECGHTIINPTERRP